MQEPLKHTEPTPLATESNPLATESNPRATESNPLHPFRVPEGYFAEFKARITERVKEIPQEPATSKVVEQLEVTFGHATKPSIRQRLRPFLVGAAAVIVMLLALTYFTREPESQGLSATNDIQEVYYPTVPDEEFDQFLIDETSEDYWGTIWMEDDAQWGYATE